MINVLLVLSYLISLQKLPEGEIIIIHLQIRKPRRGEGEAELSEVTKIVNDKESEYKWHVTKAHTHYYATLPHKRQEVPFPF